MRSGVAIAGFFLSGFAGLVYQVCWIREASLVFGSTTYAVSTVVAVFFGGLAVGSECSGRLARKTTRPLRIYALLELLLAVLAGASLILFDLADRVYGGLYPRLAGSVAALTAFRVGLVAAVVFLPSVIMGATLPLFAREFVRKKTRIAGSVGFLYGVNTAGAALGCAMAGLVLLPAIGLRASIGLGAILNVVAGLLVLAVAGGRSEAREREGEGEGEGKETAPAPGASAPPRQSGFVAAIFFLSGFATLGYQVLWTRYLSLVIVSTVHTYTVALSVVLTGIVIGSLAAAFCFDRLRRHGLVFGALFVLTGISVTAVMSLPPAAWRAMGGDLWVCFVLLLPPAVLSGAAFPLAVRLWAGSPQAATLGVGRLFAVNTAGGILGAMLTGFVVLPWMGMGGAMWLTSGTSLAAGVFAWVILSEREAGLRLAPVAATAVALLAWLGAPKLLGTRIPEDFLVEGPAELVEFREGRAATLAVTREEEGVLNLKIDRWWQGSNRQSHQAMAAHIPMILLPETERVLVVGAGTGQTPGRFLMHGIERLDCVDIEPEVFELIRSHFRGDWMDDERVNLVVEDGRSFVRHTDERYDFISIEVGQVFRPGVAPFYTIEFYEDARKRLRPGGALCQFLPLPFFSEEEFAIVLRTFLDVFPQSLLWYNTSELLLIGFHADTIEIDGAAAAKVLALASDELRRELEFRYWGGAEQALAQRPVFLAGFLSGPQGLRKLAGDGDFYSDDRPFLECAARVPADDPDTETRLVDRIREQLEPVDALPGIDLSPGEREAVVRIRDLNLGDIIAAARIREAKRLRATGDFEKISRVLAMAVSANPRNHVANQISGDALMVLGRSFEAESRYREALEMVPDDLRSRRGLAFALHQRGALAEAIEQYRAILEVTPFDAHVHNDLGAALTARGEYDEALRHLETALLIDPALPDAKENVERMRAMRGGVPSLE